MKKQRISKRMLYIILSVVLISIATLTIAYAALSSTLNISGSTNVKGSTWDITISKVNLQERYPNSIWLTGEMNVVGKHEDNALQFKNSKLISSGTINGTTINNISVSLSTPGDQLMYVYEVTNNGTIPAKLESYVQNIHTITSSTNNTSDIELISNNFIYQMLLIKREKINEKGVPDGNESLFSAGEILCPGKTVYVIFILTYSNNATSVPTSDVTISNIGETFDFIQADTRTCIES